MREFHTTARSVRGASAAEEQIHPGTGSEEHVNLGKKNEDRLPEHLHVVLEADGRTGSETLDAADERQNTAPSNVQVEAWRWAVGGRRMGGLLLTGERGAGCFGRKECWGVGQVAGVVGLV